MANQFSISLSDFLGYQKQERKKCLLNAILLAILKSMFVRGLAWSRLKPDRHLVIY